MPLADFAIATFSPLHFIFHRRHCFRCPLSLMPSTPLFRLSPPLFHFAAFRRRHIISDFSIFHASIVFAFHCRLRY